MSYFNRNKAWAIAFILLVALNVATLLTFWLVKEKRQGPPPMQTGVVEFLTKELSFDSVQRQQLETLLLEHHRQIREIRDHSRDAKDAFFVLLKEKNISDASIDSAAQLTAKYDAQTDALTFKHFRKIRSICTPQQQEKFDRIIQQVLRMLSPPPGRQGPPPGGMQGPPGGDRPPPPPNQEGPPPHEPR